VCTPRSHVGSCPAPHRSLGRANLHQISYATTPMLHDMYVTVPCLGVASLPSPARSLVYLVGSASVPCLRWRSRHSASWTNHTPAKSTTSPDGDPGPSGGEREKRGEGSHDGESVCGSPVLAAVPLWGGVRSDKDIDGFRVFSCLVSTRQMIHRLGGRGRGKGGVEHEGSATARARPGQVLAGGRVVKWGFREASRQFLFRAQVDAYDDASPTNTSRVVVRCDDHFRYIQAGTCPRMLSPRLSVSLHLHHASAFRLDSRFTSRDLTPGGNSNAK
jgi:hypothetical protein